MKPFDIRVIHHSDDPYIESQKCNPRCFFPQIFDEEKLELFG